MTSPESFAGLLPSDVRIEIIKSPEDIALEVKEYEKRAFGGRMREGSLRTSLGSFIQYIHERDDVSALGILDMPGGIVRPHLNIYALWARPLNLSTDSARMTEYHNEHSKLLSQFDPTLGSLFHIVAPPTYPTPQLLAERLSNDYGISASVSVYLFDRINK